MVCEEVNVHVNIEVNSTHWEPSQQHVRFVRYALSFATVGITIPAAIIAVQFLPGAEAREDLIYYASIVLWPSLFATYSWAPTEWVGNHPYWLRTIAIANNALLYAIVGAWFCAARGYRPGLRFAAPTVAWVLVAGLPWAFVVYC